MKKIIKMIIKMIINATIIVIVNWVFFLIAEKLYGCYKQVLPPRTFKNSIIIFMAIIDYVYLRFLAKSNGIKSRICYLANIVFMNVISAYLLSYTVESGSDDVFGYFYGCLLIMNAQIIVFIITFVEEIKLRIRTQKEL